MSMITTSAMGANVVQSAGSQGYQPSSPPKKYVVVHGIMRLNPDFIKYRKGGGGVEGSAKDPKQALPVVSTCEDVRAYQETAQQHYGNTPQYAPSAIHALQRFQEATFANRLGLKSSLALGGIEAVFAKYEVPLGMMEKLLHLEDLDKLEFLVDDSGSMTAKSNTLDATGRKQSRWEEAKGRLKEMMEVLAHVPAPMMEVRFLNNSAVIRLMHEETESPSEFLRRAHQAIDEGFQRGPYGSTPIKEVLRDSLERGKGKKVGRYLFCDGVPNGGRRAQKAIYEMLMHRESPEGNPITFLSCTGVDEDVEWMKEAEELIPFAAEYDDLADEQREVARDQGEGLPFTKGFHLIGELVGAMNPHDLDALDESIPLTKVTLENLLGVQLSPSNYQSYFEGFQAAQRYRVVETALDKKKRAINWSPLYSQFSTAEFARDIPEVQQFRASLKKTYSRNPFRKVVQIFKRTFCIG